MQRFYGKSSGVSFLVRPHINFFAYYLVRERGALCDVFIPLTIASGLTGYTYFSPYIRKSNKADFMTLFLLFEIKPANTLLFRDSLTSLWLINNSLAVSLMYQSLS